MPEIKNADGTILDPSWPSQDRPVMMDAINDADRKARQDAYQSAKEARGGLQSHSVVEVLFDGRIKRKNNSTNEIEIVNADGTPYVASAPEPTGPSF